MGRGIAQLCPQNESLKQKGIDQICRGKDNRQNPPCSREDTADRLEKGLVVPKLLRH